jgi:hypothetical protein
MNKKTKILIGVGAAIALYLILKPKKPSATTATPDVVGNQPPPIPVGIDKVQTDSISDSKSVLDTPTEGDSHPPALPVVTGPRTTKDCVQVGYNCREKTYNTIQIPLDDDCNKYQPAMPNCAGPRGGDDMMMVAPMIYDTL